MYKSLCLLIVLLGCNVPETNKEEVTKWRERSSSYDYEILQSTIATVEDHSDRISDLEVRAGIFNEDSVVLAKSSFSEVEELKQTVLDQTSIILDAIKDTACECPKEVARSGDNFQGYELWFISADWCPGCGNYDTSDILNANIEIVKCNYDSNPELFKQRGVRFLPSFQWVRTEDRKSVIDIFPQIDSTPTGKQLLQQLSEYVGRLPKPVGSKSEDVSERQLQLSDVSKYSKDSEEVRLQVGQENCPEEEMKKAVDSLRLSKDDNFIDYGCGDGFVLEYVYETYGCNCIGIEIDKRLSDLASEKFKDNPRVKIIHGDVTEYDWYDDRPTKAYSYLYPDVLNKIKSTLQKSTLYVTPYHRLDDTQTKVSQSFLGYSDGQEDKDSREPVSDFISTSTGWSNLGRRISG